jgi:hypothetical protein
MNDTTELLPISPTVMLKAVHEQMKALFVRYDALGLDESRAKSALFGEIEEGLGVHLEIEEVLFYPAVESMKSSLAISVVLKALQAHRQVKALLAEMRALSGENGSLDEKMGELKHCVLAHLGVEELEIFPHARALPPEILLDLGTAMGKLRERLWGKRESLEGPSTRPDPF